MISSNPPRVTAARLVEAYLSGQDHQTILDQEHRPEYRELATAMARATLEALRDHARIASKDNAYLKRLPAALQANVERYLDRPPQNRNKGEKQ